MDQIIIIEPMPILRPPRARIVTAIDSRTRLRLREAAKAYGRACALRPGDNRCQLAFTAGVASFGYSIGRLQSDDRETDLTRVRQQLMAFCRVISPKPRHSFEVIGRLFHRHHATVMHAAAKYGDAIEQVIGS